jgi:hypothetical protein
MTRPDEFIRRFLMHVLPKGFHRIRHYGLSANGNCAASIARAREFIAAVARVVGPEEERPIRRCGYIPVAIRPIVTPEGYRSPTRCCLPGNRADSATPEAFWQRSSADTARRGACGVMDRGLPPRRCWRPPIPCSPNAISTPSPWKQHVRRVCCDVRSGAIVAQGDIDGCQENLRKMR